jgi:hypothetical protein
MLLDRKIDLETDMRATQSVVALRLLEEGAVVTVQSNGLVRVGAEGVESKCLVNSATSSIQTNQLLCSGLAVWFRI